MKKLILAAAGLLALTALPAADGLQPERVPAAARWLVHVDLDALKATTAWSIIEANKEDFELDELEEFQREFGIDPLTDVRSFTAYSAHKGDDGGVAMFVTNSRIDSALSRLQGEDSYRSYEAGGLLLHSWAEHGDDETIYAFVHESHGDERIVIVSNDSQRILGGIRAVLGQGDTLASHRGARIQARPRKGSVFFCAAAEVPGMDEFEPASAVIGMAQGIAIDVGEAGDLLYAHASIDTETEEDARSVVEILQGGKALLTLAASSAEDVPLMARQLLGAVRFNQRGSMVVLDFEYHTGELMRMIEAAHDSHGAR